LQAVQTQVALAGLRVLGVREAEVEERASVLRPGVQRGQRIEIDLIIRQYDLLARRALDMLRRHRAQLRDLAERVLEAGKAVRQLGLQQLTDPLPDLVQALDAKGEAQPALRAEDVHRQRQLGALDVLEQQGGAVRLLHTVGDLADLEVRVDLDLDPAQLPLALKRPQEGAQIFIGHGVKYPWRSASVTRRSAEQMRVDRAHLFAQLS